MSIQDGEASTSPEKGLAAASRSGLTMPPPMSKRLFRRKLQNTLPNFLPVIVIFAHVLLAPYTKVEESFTLHAVHDVLAHGIHPDTLHLWDHITFPGAVPRSFLPPVVLGLLSYPLSCLAVAAGLMRTTVGVQILVRLVLGFISAQSINHLSRTIRQRYGASPRIWFLLLSVTQFHIPFYAGRTLPNFMALPLVNIAVSLTLRSNTSSIPRIVSHKRLRNAIIIMTAIATVLRLEIALLLVPTVFSLVITGRLTFPGAVGYGALGGLGSLLISAPLDLFLWKPTLSHPDFPFNSVLQTIWPEITGIWYNLFLGKSADWGVSPWWYYLVVGIPRTCMASLPIAGLGILWWLVTRTGMMKPSKEINGVGEILSTFGAGIIALIAGMSCLGHKEWRFVIYVVPIINIIAALTAAKLWNVRTWLRPLFRLGVHGLLLANVAVTVYSTFISHYNYPGGQAWRILEEAAGDRTDVRVHYTNHPLQTGSSLFTFLHMPHNTLALPPSGNLSQWTYSKTEESSLQTPLGSWDAGFDYVVTDDSAFANDGHWKVIGEVEGVRRISRSGKFGLEVLWEIQDYVVERHGRS